AVRGSGHRLRRQEALARNLFRVPHRVDTDGERRALAVDDDELALLDGPGVLDPQTAGEVEDENRVPVQIEHLAQVARSDGQGPGGGLVHHRADRVEGQADLDLSDGDE